MVGYGSDVPDASRRMRIPQGAMVDATDHAKEIAKTVPNPYAPVRVAFIERFETKDSPMALLIRGGQGGAVRLKLLVSMLWIGARSQDRVEFPARAWAALLGLPEAQTNGARRVSAAVQWLDNAGFLDASSGRGVPSGLRLLDERGTGGGYLHPAEAIDDIKRATSRPIQRKDLYVKIPSQSWTTGLIAELSGSGLAMLLALLAQAGMAQRTTNLWWSVDEADQRLGLSADTRRRGLDDLAGLGVVTVGKQQVRSRLEQNRYRNTYSLRLDRLGIERESMSEEGALRELTMSVDDFLRRARVGSGAKPGESGADRVR